MRIRFYFFALAACTIISSCGDKPKPVVQATTKAPAVMDPFKYHKLLEVSPGQYYDIVSWGRGAGNESSYLILHSDSTGKKYTTTIGDLDGAITDVYNSDMDMDGNPEILIQAKGTDSINFTHIYAYEFNNNQARKLEFPKLVSSKKNYHGNDNFYIQEGKLIREFPSYTGSGKDAKPTGGKYKLEYTLKDNNLDVNTLVKDSTQTADKPNATQTVKKQVEEKPKIKKTTKKKKTETHKKKRRRNRN
jgi:hypothetical protein